jgi:hypothetical protein
VTNTAEAYGGSGGVGGISRGDDGLNGGNGGGSTANTSFGLSSGGPSAGSKAQAYFTDDAPALLASINLSHEGATLNLSATLSVTTDAASSGFYGDLVIGDPPTTKGVQAFAQAAAVFAPHASAIPAPPGLWTGSPTLALARPSVA